MAGKYGGASVSDVKRLRPSCSKSSAPTYSPESPVRPARTLSLFESRAHIIGIVR